MVVYYFHLQCGEQLIRDGEGLDLPDADAARKEALAGARQIWADAIKAGKSGIPDAFVIRDESGNDILSVPFDDALPPGLTRGK